MNKFIPLLLILISFSAVAQRPVLTVHRGNEADIYRFDVSPDNKHVISVDGNKQAILWQISSGNELKRFTGVEAAAFTGNNELVFVYEDRRKTVKTDLNGNVITTYPAQKDYKSHSNVMWSLQPLDGIVISGSRLYNINSGNFTEMEYNNRIVNQSVSKYIPVLKSLIRGSASGRLYIYDENTGNIRDSLMFKVQDYDDPEWTDITEDGKLAGFLTRSVVTVKNMQSKVNVFSLPQTPSEKLVSACFVGTDKLVVMDEKFLSLYSFTTGKKIWKRNHYMQIANYGTYKGRIVMSKDKSRIFASSASQKRMLIVGTEKGDSLGSLTSSLSYTGLRMVPEFENNSMVLIGEGKVFKLNLKSGRLEDNSNPGFFIGSGVFKYKEGTVYFGDYLELSAYHVNQKNEYVPVFKQKLEFKIDELSMSFDNKYIVAATTNARTDVPECQKSAMYCLNQKGEKVWRTECEYTHAIGLANKQNIMVVGSGATGSTLVMKDIATGKKIKEIKAKFLPYSPWSNLFSPQDNYILSGNNSIYELFDLKNEASYFVAKDLPDGKHVTAYAISPDERTITLGSFDGNMYVYDIPAKQLITQPIFKNSSGSVTDIRYSQNGDFLFTNTYDNTIRVWDLNNNKLAATIFTNSEGKEFTVVSPDGRFDGKGNDFSSLYYVKGINIIPLTSTFESFYTPSLLTRILNREVFDPVPVNVFDIHPQPIITIAYKDGKQRNLEIGDEIDSYQSETGVAEITVNARAPEDVVEEIRLFHNGKVINLTTRGLIVADAGSGSDSKKYTVNLQPGLNRFRAIALNSQRTESVPQEMMITFTAKTNGNAPVVKPVNNVISKIDQVDKTATLHLLVVGINKYQNEKLSLNYATADATAFRDELEKSAKTVLTNVKTYYVSDASADKKGIIKAFTEIQQQAKPQDVFVFYYAGHGVISEKNKEFYLVPTDVNDLKNVDAILTEKGISSKVLQSYAVDIQAQKQLFILDACQSAGAFETLVANDANQQKSLAVVARSTGTHWIAASGAKQFANEFSSLGHGVFTFVLLEALKGGAFTNNMVTVNGLKRFLEVQVPELMKKYNGSEQYPASYGFGSDFPVEIRK